MSRRIIVRGPGLRGPAGADGPPGPKGNTGPIGAQGLPGVNALPADAAVAAYVADEGSNTRSALIDSFAHLDEDGDLVIGGVPVGGSGGGSGLPSNVVNRTSAYTATAGDFVLASASLGPFTITLPANPTAGQLVTVKKTDSTTNAVTVIATSKTIDGDPNAVIVAEDAGAVFGYDGSNWRILSVTSTSGPAVSPGYVTIPTDKTADFTLTTTDVGSSIGVTSGSARTVTVPTNASAPIPVGSLIEIRQVGAGQVTIAPAGGVTLRSAGGALKSRAQYSAVSLMKTAADTWSVQGDLSA